MTSNRWRASASSIGDCTWALVIAANVYLDGDIRDLPGTAEQACALFSALIDPKGCRVPRHQARLVTGPAATKNAILSAIGDICDRAGTQHSVFIYFAGHGADVGSEFALVSHDARLDDLLKTAIGSIELQARLQNLKARGLLVVLDCCGGAALAEHAPDVFRSIGQSADYRILLSSARSRQSSWEGPRGSVFTQSLVEVLSGKTVLSKNAGAIYFSDLYAFLHDSVTVDVELSLIGGAGQEPIATSSVIRDPLLFLNSDLTMRQIQVRTTRYSKRNVQRIVRRWIGGLIVAACVAGIGVWVYLAGHFFLRVDGGVLTLYRGHPNLSVSVYPRLLWQYNIDQNEIAPTSPLASGGTVVSDFAQDFRNEPVNHLTAIGKARWMINNGRVTEAHAILTHLNVPSDDHANRVNQTLLLISMANTGDIAALEKHVSDGPAEVKIAALSRLMRIAPSNGADAAARLGFQQQDGVHMQVMAELPPGCSSGTQQYLKGFASEGRHSQFIRLEIDGALRTGCTLPKEATSAGVVNATYLTDVARYLAAIRSPAEPQLSAQFMRAFVSQLSEPQDRALLADIAAYLTGAPTAPRCPSVKMFDVLMKDEEKLLAARAYVHQCLDASLWLRQSDDPSRFQATLSMTGNMATPLFAIDIPFDANIALLWPILDTLRMRRDSRSFDVLVRLSAEHSSPYIRRDAVRLLRLSHVPAHGDTASFEQTGEQTLQLEAYAWIAQTNRELILRRVRERLSDATAQFLPMLIARLALTDAEKHDLLIAAQSSQVSDHTRTTITILAGDSAKVAESLTSPYIKVRTVAADWLGWRDDLPAISARLPARALPGQPDAESLNRVAARKQELGQELREKSPEEKDWRIKLMIDLRQLNDDGVRTWLESQCNWCD